MVSGEDKKLYAENMEILNKHERLEMEVLEKMAKAGYFRRPGLRNRPPSPRCGSSGRAGGGARSLPPSISILWPHLNRPVASRLLARCP